MRHAIRREDPVITVFQLIIGVLLIVVFATGFDETTVGLTIGGAMLAGAFRDLVTSTTAEPHP